MKREIFRAAAALTVLLIGGMTFIVRAAVSEKSAAIAYTEEQKLIHKQKAVALQGSLRFQGLEPNDVNSIELFRFDWANEKKSSLHKSPLSDETIQGLIVLCKRATPTKHHDQPRPGFNYIMEVKLKKGDTLEIPFRLSFSQPFGGLDAPELMEALYALTNGCTGNIIHFDQGKILKVVKFRSGTGTSECMAGLSLNKEGQIMLTLKMSRQRGDAITLQPPGNRPMSDEEREKIFYTMNQSKAVRYGQAQLFEHDGEGYMIVDVYNPNQ